MTSLSLSLAHALSLVSLSHARSSRWHSRSSARSFGRYGPTTFFGLSNVVCRHDIGDKREVGTVSGAYPHLVFDGFQWQVGGASEVRAAALCFPPVKQEEAAKGPSHDVREPRTRTISFHSGITRTRKAKMVMRKDGGRADREGASV